MATQMLNLTHSIELNCGGAVFIHRFLLSILIIRKNIFLNNNSNTRTTITTTNKKEIKKYI